LKNYGITRSNKLAGKKSTGGAFKIGEESKSEKKKTMKAALSTLTSNFNFDAYGGAFVSTGIPHLDMFISGEKTFVGDESMGFPRSRMVSLSADNGIGKSTNAIEFSKNICKRGGRTFFFDFEHGLNVKSIKSYGVEEFMRFNKDGSQDIGNSKFISIEAYSYVQTLYALEEMFDKYDDIDFIVVDSLRRIMPDIEGYEFVESLPMGLQAKIESFFLPKFAEMISKYKRASCLFLNQYRNKSLPNRSMYKTEAGGQAFGHTFDIRIVAKKTGELVRRVGKTEEVYGHTMELTVKKSRFGNQFYTLDVPIIYGVGISILMLYIMSLEKAGFIKGGGAGWYELDIPGVSGKAQGMENFATTVIKPNFPYIDKFIRDNNIITLGYNVEMKKIVQMEESASDKMDDEIIAGGYMDQSVAGIIDGMKQEMDVFDDPTT